MSRIDEVLERFNIKNPVLVEEITDRPDLLFACDGGRLGIEVTRLDYEEYCKWLNQPPGSPYDRAAEVEINLPKMYSTVIKKKGKKYYEYVRDRNLTKCWLVLHNNIFEFPEVPPKEDIPSVDWIQRHSQYEFQDIKCPYDRVLFNLEHPNLWYSLFDKQIYLARETSVYRWPSIIQYESAVQIEGLVAEVRLGDPTLPREWFS